MIQQCTCTVIGSEWVEKIENYAYIVDANTTAEIVVCVFPSLYGHGIKDRSGAEIHDIVKLGVYIFNEEPLEVYDGTQTGIGKRGKDNGVLIIAALEERQWRIEVGYGLEGYITDIEANLIAQKYLVPAFQQGNYGEGLYDTVIALGQQIPPSNEPNNLKIRGYYYYESSNISSPPSTPFWEWEIFGIPLWVIVLLILFGVFIPVFGRGSSRGSGRWGGGGSGHGGRSGGGGAGGRW
ncbi:MAG: TPM domain-containing protein [Candidatus Bathyarchaeia archaeon]